MSCNVQAITYTSQALNQQTHPSDTIKQSYQLYYLSIAQMYLTTYISKAGVRSRPPVRTDIPVQVKGCCITGRRYIGYESRLKQDMPLAAGTAVMYIACQLALIAEPTGWPTLHLEHIACTSLLSHNICQRQHTHKSQSILDVSK